MVVRVVAPALITLGLKTADAAVGRPVTVSASAPGTPVMTLVVTVKLNAAPAVTDPEDVDSARVNSTGAVEADDRDPDGLGELGRGDPDSEADALGKALAEVSGSGVGA